VTDRHHFPLEAAAALAPSPGSLAADVFAHGTLSLEFYSPRGSGWFKNGDVRHRFAPGDALFVPAGIDHRFEDFSDDFGTWVMFYGPAGGETGT
jgi:hypothetical protein